ncbi:ATP-dependent protease subunit HslV [Truepera radiovictrix]|uniref:20S proteasome A and B subunits n=1 Tax=Truepera radiovictrix (strain DSM 17093 / CIP 108686 / LMG 22925 / RQ-24) TaxID=649638 RepID=D7CR99_TRURR|nr:20S proteasome A and B subunits [Truepera radiovictrix DSM 17093]
MHGTTIVAVHKDGVTAIAGDGQVTLGDTIVKKGATKVRSLMDGRVITGFAGAVSDAFTLLEKFEGYLSTYRGNLMRAAVETVKEWRTDRMLRNLEAMLIVADAEQILTLSGAGDVIAPDEPIAAVGSGGAYAQAAATALLRHSDMSAAEIAETALLIAADIDIYTSGTATVLKVPDTQDTDESDEAVLQGAARSQTATQEDA